MQPHSPKPVRIALFQPDIAPNVGAIIRTGACLGVPVEVIEPCGFAFSPAAVRRQAMDYAAHAEIVRHSSWEAFLDARDAAGAGRTSPGRLVALTTAGATALWDFRFRAGDTLLLGRESAGLPAEVHARADARVVIPMAAGTRSLNVGVAAAIAVAEALRQLSRG